MHPFKRAKKLESKNWEFLKKIFKVQNTQGFGSGPMTFNKSVKNYRTGTKFKLNLHIYKIKTYIKFKLNVWYGCCDNDRNFPFFFQSSRGITLLKKWTETKLILCIHKMHQYIEFGLNVCKVCWDKDRKMNNDGMTEEWNDG